MTNKELFDKVLRCAGRSALDSEEEFTRAAERAGFSKGEIEDLLKEFDGFPLDDEELDGISGGTDGVEGKININNSNVPFYVL